MPFVSQTEAAKLLNVHRDTVMTAKRVQRDGIPELVEQVKAGEVTLHAADDLAKLPAEEQEQVVPEVAVSVEPEPLYVRRRAGAKYRYMPATPTAKGEKFRKRVSANGRAKYEQCL